MANIEVMFSDVIFYPLMIILFILGSVWLINYAINKKSSCQIVYKPDGKDIDFEATTKVFADGFKSVIIRAALFVVVMIVIFTAGLAARDRLLNPNDTPQNRKEKERIRNIENHVDQPLQTDVTPKHEEKLKTFDEKMAEEAKKIKDRNTK